MNRLAFPASEHPSRSNVSVAPVAYRPDIDGLRAFAVLVVVGFHAFPAAFPGGFIGVDVFFVISGYLITSIVRADLAGGRFSLAGFYNRRIRRIFPALLLVLGACLGAGWFLLLADEYLELGKHVAAGAGFASNLVLLSESGYFDTASEKKILLHLWSLAIEEQFYLVWPILLLMLTRLRAMPIAIGVLILASLALSVHEVRSDRVLAFFSPAARAWELLLGGLLAIGEAAVGGQRVRRRFAEAISVVGFLLLALGLALIRRNSAFPGGWVVLPTLGAACVIAAGPGAWLNRHFLAARPAMWIGKISYPLYLWHWPVLAFAYVLAAGLPSITMRWAAVGLAFVASWFTFRVVEQPVRHSSRALLAVWLAGAMVLFGASGLALMRSGGAPDRAVARTPALHPGDIGHPPFMKAMHALPNYCQQYAQFPYQCFQTQQGMVKPKLAIFGDSHAEHLGLGLAEQLPGMNVVVFSAMDLPSLDTEGNRRLVSYLAGDARIAAVVVVAAWYVRLTPAASAGFGAGLVSLAGQLKGPGRAVYFAEDVPHFHFSPEQCKYRDLPGRSHGCAEGRAFLDAQRGLYLPALERAARDSGAGMIAIADQFCPGDSCSMLIDGVLAYRDTNHLGINGSRAVARRMIAQMPQVRDTHPR